MEPTAEIIELKQPLASLCGKDLTTAILTDEPTCVKMLATCGTAVSRAGEPFANPYVAHDENDSASLWAPEGGRYAVWISHNAEDGRKSICITVDQYYRDRCVGFIDELQRGEDGMLRRKLGKVEKALWLLRLAATSGVIDLPPTDAVFLREAPEHIRRVYDGTVLLMQCRQRYDPANDGFPATVGFLRDWTGVREEKELVQAKRYMVSHGFWQVQTPGARREKGVQGVATIYRQGTADEVRVRDKAARKKEKRDQADARIDSTLKETHAAKKIAPVDLPGVTRTFQTWEEEQAAEVPQRC